MRPKLFTVIKTAHNFRYIYMILFGLNFLNLALNLAFGLSSFERFWD